MKRLEVNRQGVVGSKRWEKWGNTSWEGNGRYNGRRSGGVARGYGQRGSRCNVCVGGSGIALDVVRIVI